MYCCFGLQILASWGVYTDENNITKTRYYYGNYERTIKNNIIEEVDYIFTPVGFTAMRVYNDVEGLEKLYYLHTDNLGSIQAITDENKAIVSSYYYTPWGGRILLSGANITDRGYTFHEHLEPFGLINMNGRVCDPVLARFLSPDNYVQAPDYTQNFNRYAYCLNNPFKYTDPSGEYAVVDDIICIVIGGVVNVITNAGSIHNFGQGLAYFGVGAAGGAVSLYASPIAGAALMSAGNNVLTQGFTTGFSNIKFDQVLMSGTMGALTSWAGGQLGNTLSRPIGSLTSGIGSPVLKDMATQSLTNAGAGFILSSGMSLANGDSFEQAMKAGGQSALMGAGIGAINGTVSGFKYAHENNVDPWNGLSNVRIQMDKLPTPEIKLLQTNEVSKPTQIHHFATDKNSEYTPQMQAIADKYELSLKGDWNKASLPHQGRHPNDYHQWVLDNMTMIDKMPNMNSILFQQQFKINVIRPILNNPNMLYKNYWLYGR